LASILMWPPVSLIESRSGPHSSMEQAVLG
jgi:hypothetical protein